MKYDKVIFVCTDNTSRSIMAEAIFRAVAKKPVKVISRGVVVLFPEPMNPKAVAVLKNANFAPSKRESEPLVKEDLEGEGTLVLTMTAKERADIMAKYPDLKNCMTLGDFVSKPGDIADPSSGGLEEWGAVFEYIDLMVKVAAEIIFKEDRKA